MAELLRLSVQAEPISGPNMNTKFANASSDSRHVTKIARLNLPQSYTDPRLSDLVTQTLKPLRERLAAIIARIT